MAEMIVEDSRALSNKNARAGQLQPPDTAAASWRSVSHCSLEPDLNFVAIRISDVSVGEAGSELATTEQAPSGAFDLGDGTVDVIGVH
jgi:hypothetical protein